MDVVFASAGLAAVCNSKAALAEQWGPELGGLVGRRLLDLAAVDATNIERLPGAEVENAPKGQTRIRFAGAFVIKGAIRSTVRSKHATGVDAHTFLISDIEILEGGDSK